VEEWADDKLEEHAPGTFEELVERADDAVDEQTDGIVEVAIREDGKDLREDVDDRAVGNFAPELVCFIEDIERKCLLVFMSVGVYMSVWVERTHKKGSSLCVEKKKSWQTTLDRCKEWALARQG